MRCYPRRSCCLESSYPQLHGGRGDKEEPLKKSLVSLLVVATLTPFVIVSTALAQMFAKPEVLSFVAVPDHVPQAGGTVVLTIRARNATTCSLGGQLTVDLGCTTNKLVVYDKIATSPTDAPGLPWVWLVVRGRGRWRSLNFGYTSANLGRQIGYLWKA